MICDVEESRSGQFRLIICEIATSDPHVLNLCCQGVSHMFNFNQSQVKLHKGLTCIRVCGFCKLMFSIRSIEYSLVRACLRHRSTDFLQAWVFISPCVFSTSSIVPPGLCSVQSVWSPDKFCSINFCSKAGGTTLRHSGLILVLWAVRNHHKMTFFCAAPMMVCAVPSV